MTNANFAQDRRAESRRTELRRLESRRGSDYTDAEWSFLIDSDLDLADAREAVAESRRRAADRLTIPRYALILIAGCLLLILGVFAEHIWKVWP